jgi:hypothetical protein
MPVITGEDDPEAPGTILIHRSNEDSKRYWLTVASLLYGHSSITGDDSLWQCTPAKAQSPATDAYPTKQYNQGMRKLIVKLAGGSAR